MEKKPLSVKGLFDKNAVPASLTAVVFMFTYGALENFAAKFAAEKGLQGIGFWQAGRELAQAWPLLDALLTLETL